MTNLLQDGIKLGVVVPTDLTKKLTIDGLTNTYKVYKIRIDYLYYNDLNDRIATGISKYKFDNKVDSLDKTNLKEYNSIIEKFVADSNPSALKKTRDNIHTLGQKEPGVVLNDGRVIDGNRRFTCLRILSKTDDKFKYFESAIIDKEINTNRKEIKILELTIQLGEDTKITYNPIDRLVGIYNDIIDKKLLTIDEYAKSTNETPSDIKQKVEQARLMVEFLEFINAPKQFYIARDLDIESPLLELYKLLNRCKDDDKEDFKMSVFSNLVMKPNSDMGKYIRQIKSIADSEFIEEFLKDQMELADEVLEIIPTTEVVSTKYINENIRTKSQVTEKLKDSMERYDLKAKKTEAKNKPLQQIDKSIIILESIDLQILNKLDNKELRRIKNKIENLQIQIDKINESVENCLCK